MFVSSLTYSNFLIDIRHPAVRLNGDTEATSRLGIQAYHTAYLMSISFLGISSETFRFYGDQTKFYRILYNCFTLPFLRPLKVYFQYYITKSEGCKGLIRCFCFWRFVELRATNENIRFESLPLCFFSSRDCLVSTTITIRVVML